MELGICVGMLIRDMDIEQCLPPGPAQRHLVALSPYYARRQHRYMDQEPKTPCEDAFLRIYNE